MKTPKGIAKRKSPGRQIKLAEPASFSPVRYAILTRNPKIVPRGSGLSLSLPPTLSDCHRHSLGTFSAVSSIL
jgi:hypothetical protein